MPKRILTELEREAIEHRGDQFYKGNRHADHQDDTGHARAPVETSVEEKQQQGVDYRHPEISGNRGGGQHPEALMPPEEAQAGKELSQRSLRGNALRHALGCPDAEEAGGGCEEAGGIGCHGECWAERLDKYPG
jgi:hypothetical protein